MHVFGLWEEREPAQVKLCRTLCLMLTCSIPEAQTRNRLLTFISMPLAHRCDISQEDVDKETKLSRWLADIRKYLKCFSLFQPRRFPLLCRSHTLCEYKRYGTGRRSIGHSVTPFQSTGSSKCFHFIAIWLLSKTLFFFLTKRKRSVDKNFINCKTPRIPKILDWFKLLNKRQSWIFMKVPQ